MTAQMLWDAHQDPNKLIDEFFKLHFAEAEKPMREYYRMLHETSYFSENRGDLHSTGRVDPGADRPAVCEACRGGISLSAGYRQEAA